MRKNIVTAEVVIFLKRDGSEKRAIQRLNHLVKNQNIPIFYSGVRICPGQKENDHVDVLYSHVRPEVMWFCRSKEVYTDRIWKAYNRVLRILKGKGKEIKNICSEFDAKAQMGIVISVNKTESPVIYFSEECISFVNQIGGDIEIDEYDHRNLRMYAGEYGKQVLKTFAKRLRL